MVLGAVARISNHLDSKAIRVREEERSGRPSRCPDRSSRFGPLNDAALDELCHAVLRDDAPDVLHAGHVAVRQRDAAWIAIFGGDHARQTTHTAAKFEDSSVATNLAVLEQVIGQALLRGPNAHVSGVVEADQLVGGEALVYPTYLHGEQLLLQRRGVLVPVGVRVGGRVLQASDL